MTDQQLPKEGQGLREQAIARLKRKRDFGAHLFVYLVVNGFLIGIWAFIGAGFFWPVFLLFGWGIGLVLNALADARFWLRAAGGAQPWDRAWSRAATGHGHRAPRAAEPVARSSSNG